MVQKSNVVCHLLGGSGRSVQSVAPVAKLPALFLPIAQRFPAPGITDRLAA